jgi:aminoglycoside phosphotransferase (APT) family kinase protein
VLLHRDYYDKQIFIEEDGRTGLLDFDLLATGEAALDVANALVHFELRALQGRYSTTDGARAKAAFIAAYRPTPVVAQRLQAYADATRLRLACVYSCRPAGLAHVSALLASIGQVV